MRVGLGDLVSTVGVGYFFHSYSFCVIEGVHCCGFFEHFARFVVPVKKLTLMSEKVQLIVFCVTITCNFYSLEFCLILFDSVSDVTIGTFSLFSPPVAPSVIRS